MAPSYDPIQNEDPLLFPLAQAVVSPREMSEVAQICLQIEGRPGSTLRTVAGPPDRPE